MDGKTPFQEGLQFIDVVVRTVKPKAKQNPFGLRFSKICM